MQGAGACGAAVGGAACGGAEPCDEVVGGEGGAVWALLEVEVVALHAGDVGVVRGKGVLVAIEHLVEDTVGEQRVGGVERRPDPRLRWREVMEGGDGTEEVEGGGGGWPRAGRGAEGGGTGPHPSLRPSMRTRLHAHLVGTEDGALLLRDHAQVVEQVTEAGRQLHLRRRGGLVVGSGVLSMYSILPQVVLSLSLSSLSCTSGANAPSPIEMP